MNQRHVLPVTGEQLQKVYTNKFARKGKPGRGFYDKLIALPAQGVCPLCGQRVVSTLDHYLPKAHYPLLSVVPNNLVAACSECNKAKLDSVPICAEDQTLHPYYDDVEQEQWLFSEVVIGTPVSVRFFVNPPDAWDDVIKSRIRKHFSDLRLGALYASHSGSELAVQRVMLAKVAERGGYAKVREQLQDLYESYSSIHVNSWQTAMYQAVVSNKWYCEGGFNSI
jgi:HNH endonuclease.